MPGARQESRNNGGILFRLRGLRPRLSSAFKVPSPLDRLSKLSKSRSDVFVSLNKPC